MCMLCTFLSSALLWTNIKECESLKYLKLSECLIAVIFLTPVLLALQLDVSI